jgi:hypothetical protein
MALLAEEARSEPVRGTAKVKASMVLPGVLAEELV